MKSLITLLIGLSLVAVISAASVDLSYNLKKITKTDERVLRNGYPAESHVVQTSDGYILNLFRIPYSKKLNNSHKVRPAVLLQHGFVSNSDCWVSGGPDNALAYVLADAGFDVWMGNARGNIYSRNNAYISIDHPKFWHFSWHEIGIIDIPAMIDYIIEKTGQTKIHYAGHSQGTTVYFVMLSEHPEYNDKIKSAHMLAPCAFFEHGESIVFRTLGPSIGTPGTIWNKAAMDMEFLPQNRLINRIGDSACGLEPSMKFLCKNLWLLFAGDGYENTNLTALQELVETHPGGASSNQGIHFLQLGNWNTGRFCQMDWGAKKNTEIYGKPSPPDYNLENIQAPTYFYVAHNDGLCHYLDVDNLASKIKNLAGVYHIPEKSFNHLDFIVANEMREMVNDPVKKNILKHEGSL